MRKTMIWKRAVAACLATIMLVSAPGSYSVGKEVTVETAQVSVMLDEKASEMDKEASGEDIVLMDLESEAASTEETQSKETAEPTSSENCNDATGQTQETTIEGSTKEEGSMSGIESKEENSASETESKEESSTSETESEGESSTSKAESKEESSTSETKSEEESTEEMTTEEEKLDVPVLKEGKTLVDASVLLYWQQVVDADGYYIYRKQQGDDWQKIADVTQTKYHDSEVSEGQTYYYTVAAYDSEGHESDYDGEGVEVETQKQTPTMKKAFVRNTREIGVEWEVLQDASCYYVYRKTDSSEWEQIDVLYGQVSSWTDAAADYGVKYIYTVRAGFQYDDELILSDYAKDGVSAKIQHTLPSVTGFHVGTVQDTAVQLKWDSVDGAQGYVIYQYDAEAKTWKRIAKTTNTNTSYIVKDLIAGTNYQFAIRGYQTLNQKENLSTSYPVREQRTKLSTVTGFKTSQVKDTSVQLEWNGVVKADGYAVYQYSASEKMWKRIAETTDTSYTVENLSAGTDCWFAVKGYQTVNGKENVSVSYPKVKQRTKLSTVTGFCAAQVKDTSVQLQWNALSKASGYIIYQYDTSANEWKRIAKTTNTSTSYTVSNLRNNTSCQFAIRGYQGVNGEENTSISYPTLEITTRQRGNHTTVNGKVLPVSSVRTSEAKISLTFDSAWDTEDLGQILSILNKYNVTACFFVTGGFVDKHPEAIQLMLDNGHTIGSHGNTHTRMTTLSTAQKYAEVNDLHQKMKNRFGVEMKYFRPPYGDFDNDTINTALNQNYMPIRWSVDSLDWKNYGVQSIIDAVVNNSAMRNGAIILMHNGSAYTAQALEQVIVQLQYRGYQFVSLDDLVLDYNYHVDAAGTQIGY